MINSIAIPVKILVFSSILGFNTIGAFASSGSPTTFYFHIDNVGIGDDVRIEVTGESGQRVQYRETLIGMGNFQRQASAGSFSIGETVTACITNFDDKYEDCSTATISAYNDVDINLKADDQWISLFQFYSIG